jgi:hypothetical protein
LGESFLEKKWTWKNVFGKKERKINSFTDLAPKSFDDEKNMIKSIIAWLIP